MFTILRTILLLAAPFLVRAEGFGGLVPCDDSTPSLPSGVAGPPVPGTGPCDFNAFIQLIANVYNYFIYIAVPVATLAILYAGILMAFNPGDTGKREQGKKILWTTIKGLVFVLGGYILIKTLLVYFLNPVYPNPLP